VRDAPIPNPGSEQAKRNKCKCGVAINDCGRGAFTAANGRVRFVTDHEVAAIDEANERTPLCVKCRASFPVGLAGLCASCLYDFYPDDDSSTSTTSEAHAA
jgi:hypothetical protein